MEAKDDTLYEKYFPLFKNGDYVSWLPLGEPREYGIIQSIEPKYFDGEKQRKFAIAHIMTNERTVVQIPLKQLKLESRIQDDEK